MHLSLRYQLGLALVLVNVLVTAGVAVFAYRAAHDALVDQTLAAVSLVAQSRERELLELLEARQERLAGFLDSVQSLCSETGPSGRLAFEQECLRTAVRGFHQSERAEVTVVMYRDTLLARAGGPPQVAEPLPDRLARIPPASESGQYAMAAVHGDLSVHSEFAVDDINAIFRDRAGLESEGEAFLTDEEGYSLTASDRPSDGSYPVAGEAVEQCLRGAPQALQTTDHSGGRVIAGLLPAPAIGAGCIIANVSYDQAMLPVQRLARLMTWASMLVGLVGGAVSVLIASAATSALRRLSLSTRALAAGQFDAPVPVEGPSDVRQLAQTLRTMGASIGELIAREQRARRDAEDANRTKDAFLATLSHELRTPLNAILGWASIIARSEYDRSRVSHAIHVIERNARIQVQMIEELLDVSRIAAGAVRLTISDVAVAGVIDAALESVRPSADAKGVSLGRRLDEPDLTLPADARRLQQVVWNLLSNAVRFTGQGGRVDVSLSRHADHVVIRVADTGVGIAPEFLPYVFQRFRQADSGSTRLHGGLGLGLAIVRDLVELHGGTVMAESEGEGRGATFTVRLPATGAQRAPQAPARTDTAAPLAGSCVLAVDDDVDTLDVLRTVLEDAGADVVTCRSAYDARTALRKIRPDLLIADIGMPEEDGYALIAWIRQGETGTSHLPAIALTARTSPEDVRRVLQAGFQQHLGKPVDAGRLVDAAASLLAVPR